MPITLLLDLDDTLLNTNMDVFIPAYFKALSGRAGRYDRPGGDVTGLDGWHKKYDGQSGSRAYPAGSFRCPFLSETEHRPQHPPTSYRSLLRRRISKAGRPYKPHPHSHTTGGLGFRRGPAGCDRHESSVSTQSHPTSHALGRPAS